MSADEKLDVYAKVSDMSKYLRKSIEQMPKYYRYDIGDEIKKLLRAHKDKIFLVTKVGCGIAGYTVEQVAPMFRPCTALENVYLPAEFFNYYNK